MREIKVTTNFPDWPLIRQTPGRSGLWNDCRFHVNQETEACDSWVVYDDLLRPETVQCPPQNTVLITAEPPSIKHYPRAFLAQFATVVTCHRGLKHPNIIYSQQGLPWMVGRRFLKDENRWEDTDTQDYDTLAKNAWVRKEKLLSVISSDKAFTPGHQARRAFVQRLQEHFGKRIDVYGRGVHDVEDKWEAIAPYQYHIVLENSRYDDYWTEKLADAFLAGAYPFYWGCPNLSKYFAPEAFTAINLEQPEVAIHTIETIIAQNVRQEQEAALCAAKEQILNRYQMFPVMEAVLPQYEAANFRQTVGLRPALHFKEPFLMRLTRRVFKPCRKREILDCISQN